MPVIILPHFAKSRTTGRLVAKNYIQSQIFTVAVDRKTSKLSQIFAKHPIIDLANHKGRMQDVPKNIPASFITQNLLPRNPTINIEEIQPVSYNFFTHPPVPSAEQVFEARKYTY